MATIRNKKGYDEGGGGECMTELQQINQWLAKPENYHLEFKEYEDVEKCLLCKCGAWRLSEDGKPLHVADCYCGAE